ncbi:MAG: tetratricopeptide repeat protein [Treponema sp.]|nr:tetratricopeptide repeat protein [Treponema sp.]
MKETVYSLNKQAIELSDRGNYEEAIACFRRAITVEKNNHLLFFNLGITYFHAGDGENAKNALLQAHFLNPEEIQVLEMLAIVCNELGEKEEAMFYCTEALDLNYYNPAIWNTIGVIYFSVEEYNDACEAFEQAVSLNPYYYDAFFNLRDTYEELGNRVGVETCEKQMETLKGHKNV